MKKRKPNLKVIIGLLLLVGAATLAFLAVRLDRHDYSQAVELNKAKTGQPAFCRIEALEEPFAHDDKLQYHLGYDGGLTYLIAISPEDLEKLKQQEHTVSHTGLLTIFSQPQTLSGCCRPIEEELRQILLSEYNLSAEDRPGLLGDSLLAVNQPVGSEKLTYLATGSLICLLVAIVLLVFGRKGKEKEPEEVCNKTVYLVE